MDPTKAMRLDELEYCEYGAGATLKWQGAEIADFPRHLDLEALLKMIRILRSDLEAAGSTLFQCGADSSEGKGGHIIFQDSDGAEILRVTNTGVYMGEAKIEDAGEVHRGLRAALAGNPRSLDLHEAIDRAEAENETLRARIEDLSIIKNTIEALQARIEDLGKILETTRQERDTEQAFRRELANRLAEANATIHEMNNEVEILRAGRNRTMGEGG